MSQLTKEMKEFAQRLCSDGYPTHIFDRAITRMEAMEALIVDLMIDEQSEGDNHEQESE